MRFQLPALIFLFTPVAFAEDVAIAPKAPQVLAQNGWQIVESATVVPGTEMNRAQSFHRIFYCGKLGAAKGRIIWEERSTGTHFHPLRIAADGTVVGRAYSNKLLIIGPDDLPGKPGDGTAIVMPDQKPKTETAIIRANAAGLVVHLAEHNKTVPVYFLPLDGKKPLPEKAVELCTRDANGLWGARAGFDVSDKWIVWSSGSFEVATGKIRKRVAELGVITDIGIDGDLVLSRRSAVADDKRTLTELVAIDLKTGAPKGRLAIDAATRFIALHDGIVYLLDPIPTEVGDRKTRNLLRAYDFSKPAEPLMSKIVMLEHAWQTQVRTTATGFVMLGAEEVSTAWIVRVKK